MRFIVSFCREDAIRIHSRRIFHDLFEAGDDKLFVVLDGTYVYVERPLDFEIQKLTYSGQKKRNLVKPFMIVLPSGYILDAPGPYWANGKNNDSGILNQLLQPGAPLHTYLLPGDHTVVDRGFRDSQTGLRRLEIACHMPNLLKQSQKQFKTKEANKSRIVTILRWLVEAVNGRIKKKFKMFRNVVPGGMKQYYFY
jgi:hypothetical protein